MTHKQNMEKKNLGPSQKVWTYITYYICLLTAQPVQSEPQTATMVLTITTGVTESPLGTSLLGLASKFVDPNSPSSMLFLSIFLGRWKTMFNCVCVCQKEKETWLYAHAHALAHACGCGCNFIRKMSIHVTWL